MSTVTPITTRRGRSRGRLALAVLSAAVLAGTAACGTGDGGEQAGPSPSQAETTAEASASASSASRSASADQSEAGGSADPTTAPSSADDGASSSADSADGAPATSAAPTRDGDEAELEDPDEIVASVPGNYRGSDSTTLAPGEAERVLPAMRAAVVPASEMPGSVVRAERVQEMPDVPFAQPLPLDGVQPTGECGDLVRRIDEATVPHTVLLHTGYDVDPGSTDVLGPEASVGSFLVYTPSVEDLTGPYGALPDTCGTLTGEDGTEVEFSAVDGVPGAVVVRSSGPRGDSVVTLGGASSAHRHLSVTYVQVDPEVAAEMLRAQIEAFRAAE